MSGVIAGEAAIVQAIVAKSLCFAILRDAAPHASPSETTNATAAKPKHEKPFFRFRSRRVNRGQNFLKVSADALRKFLRLNELLPLRKRSLTKASVCMFSVAENGLRLKAFSFSVRHEVSEFLKLLKRLQWTLARAFRIFDFQDFANQLEFFKRGEGFNAFPTRKQCAADVI